MGHVVRLTDLELLSVEGEVVPLGDESLAGLASGDIVLVPADLFRRGACPPPAGLRAGALSTTRKKEMSIRDVSKKSAEFILHILHVTLVTQQ